MGEKFGSPYSTFPFSCMEYGKSSTGESGGTCGCLTSAAQVISLFYPRKVAIPIQQELFRWYELTSLPVFKPAEGKAILVDKELPECVSDSILCHISVARWCSKSGYASGSNERTERCSRLTADTARKVAELINAQMDNSFKQVLKPSEVYMTCTTEGCHGGNPDVYSSTSLKGRMDCTPCHTGGDYVKNKLIDHP